MKRIAGCRRTAISAALRRVKGKTLVQDRRKNSVCARVSRRAVQRVASTVALCADEVIVSKYDGRKASRRISNQVFTTSAKLRTECWSLENHLLPGKCHLVTQMSRNKTKQKHSAALGCADTQPVTTKA